MTNQAKLKIGLDYHGVIDCNPQYFAEFCRYVRQKGHKIYVLSGAPKAQVDIMLKSIGLECDFVFSIVDYCLALRYVEQNFYEFIINPSLWNSAKAAFCHRSGVDLHIDDSVEYQHYFAQGYCRYYADKCLCRAQNGAIIDFNVPFSQVLVAINAICKSQNCHVSL